MRLSIAVACLALVCAANALDESEWTSYKEKHGKVYENEQEDALRMNLYAQRKAHVERHNAQNSASYKAGLNHLSDWTEAELQTLNGYRMPANLISNGPYAQKFIDDILNDSAPLPDEIDWRKVPGRVSGVKDQGQCGSCWAFAVNGLLEGQELSRKNMSANGLIPLSEQNLVDCVDDCGGCDGGDMQIALNSIHEQGGVDDEKSYPYEGKDNECRFKKDKVVISDKGSALLPEGDEDTLQEFVAKYGPVAVAIQATKNFQAYESGIFDDDTCFDELNHGVLVVGYGTDKHDRDYWIVKNSWGADWGDHGYIKMARNADNLCGIALIPTIATF